jgi:hypothetical protein
MPAVRLSFTTNWPEPLALVVMCRCSHAPVVDTVPSFPVPPFTPLTVSLLPVSHQFRASCQAYTLTV